MVQIMFVYYCELWTFLGHISCAFLFKRFEGWPRLLARLYLMYLEFIRCGDIHACLLAKCLHGLLGIDIIFCHAYAFQLLVLFYIICLALVEIQTCSTTKSMHSCTHFGFANCCYDVLQTEY